MWSIPYLGRGPLHHRRFQRPQPRFRSYQTTPSEQDWKSENNLETILNLKKITESVCVCVFFSLNNSSENWCLRGRHSESPFICQKGLKSMHCLKMYHFADYSKKMIFFCFLVACFTGVEKQNINGYHGGEHSSFSLTPGFRIRCFCLSGFKFLS